MQWPRCQQENPTSHKFCRECGTPLARLEEGVQPPPSYADLQRSLTEALEQQTTTSEILPVISSSPADVQPVFETILDSAKRLLDAFSVTVAQRAGAELHLAALSSVSEVSDSTVREAFPLPIKDTSSAGRLSFSSRRSSAAGPSWSAMLTPSST
jgi:hypothetical protein